MAKITISKLIPKLARSRYGDTSLDIDICEALGARVLRMENLPRGKAWKTMAVDTNRWCAPPSYTSSDRRARDLLPAGWYLEIVVDLKRTRPVRVITRPQAEIMPTADSKSLFAGYRVDGYDICCCIVAAALLARQSLGQR